MTGKEKGAKRKATKLDRMVRWCRRNLRVVEVNPGAHSSRLHYHMRMDNTEARALVQRVADQCTAIVDSHGMRVKEYNSPQTDWESSGARKAAAAIRREFGIEEGKDGSRT